VLKMKVYPGQNSTGANDSFAPGCAAGHFPAAHGVGAEIIIAKLLLNAGCRVQALSLSFNNAMRVVEF